MHHVQTPTDRIVALCAREAALRHCGDTLGAEDCRRDIDALASRIAASEWENVYRAVLAGSPDHG